MRTGGYPPRNRSAPIRLESQRTVGAAVLTFASGDIELTGETATVTGDAEAGGSISVGTDYNLLGATATVGGGAPNTATLELADDGPVSLIGDTAGVTVKARKGSLVVGTAVAGDMYQSPTVIGWNDGSVTWSTGDYTTQSSEPTSSTTFYRSRWFVYYGNRLPVVFNASSNDTDLVLDIWSVSADFTDPDDWVEFTMLAGDDVTAAEIFATPTVPILIRVANQSDADDSVSLEWTVTDVPITDAPEGSGPQLQVLDPDVEFAPSSVTFSLYDVGEGEEVSLSISPDPLSWGEIETFTADETGIILGETLPLDGPLPVGQYQVVALHAGGVSTDTFDVLDDPVDYPPDEPADADPLTTTVTRWTLHDRAGDLPDFEFTYNPETMTSPWRLRQYTMDSTTSPESEGTAMVWEATRRAVDWQFSGYIDSEADIDAIQAYVDLNRRFYLIDHRQRQWIVTFKGWELEPKRVFATPYAHRYTVTALIYYLRTEGETI